MATTKSSYRFLSSDLIQTPMKTNSTEFEFDESDIWGGSTRSDSSEPCTPPTWRKTRKPTTPARRKCVSSLPVNIPDWSKILRDEYKADKWNFEFDGGVNGAGFDSDGNGEGDGDGDGEGDEWIPPHKYLATTRMASLSVHEGIGRTLKGRDLSKLRNAIWEKTGFQD